MLDDDEDDDEEPEGPEEAEEEDVESDELVISLTTYAVLLAMSEAAYVIFEIVLFTNC